MQVARPNGAVALGLLAVLERAPVTPTALPTTSARKQQPALSTGPVLAKVPVMALRALPLLSLAALLRAQWIPGPSTEPLAPSTELASPPLAAKPSAPLPSALS